MAVKCKTFSEVLIKRAIRHACFRSLDKLINLKLIPIQDTKIYLLETAISKFQKGLLSQLILHGTCVEQQLAGTAELVDMPL